jgi:hypothetical protein
MPTRSTRHTSPRERYVSFVAFVAVTSAVIVGVSNYRVGVLLI